MKFNFLLDALFPRRCVLCGAGGMLLCSPCQSTVGRIQGPVCLTCSRPTRHKVNRCRECRGRKLYFKQALAFTAYTHAGREVVHALKFAKKPALATPMAQIMATHIDLTPYTVVTFVPAHAKNLRRRGYNPAELLAAALARESGKPLYPLLRKVRSTARQSSLGFKERSGNVKGAFAPLARPPALPAGELLLIDDIYTTGTTANACAKVLHSAFKAPVTVLTFARTMLD